MQRLQTRQGLTMLSEVSSTARARVVRPTVRTSVPGHGVWLQTWPFAQRLPFSPYLASEAAQAVTP